jgi:beta-N-acetylhexosaminidase
LVLPRAKRLSQADTSDKQTNRLAEFLGRRTGRLAVETYDPQAPLEGLAEVVRGASQADVVLVGLVNAAQFPDQGRLLARLRAVRPVVALVLRDPYDAGGIPPGIDVLATYSTQDASMEALAAGLFGEEPFPGRLPVALVPQKES